jgi:hypothetical protein
MIQTVSDKESRRVCSFPELPKAVRGLLNWKKFLERGSGNSFGTHHSTTIRIHDELTALLDTGD